MDFRNVGGLLASPTHAKEFTTVIIDTVDELFRMCEEQVLKDLGIQHASDAGYGKGWRAIADKWRLRIGSSPRWASASWFISHAKDVEIEQRIGKLTKTVPTLPPRAWDFLKASATACSTRPRSRRRKASSASCAPRRRRTTSPAGATDWRTRSHWTARP